MYFLLSYLKQGPVFMDQPLRNTSTLKASPKVESDAQDNTVAWKKIALSEALRNYWLMTVILCHKQSCDWLLSRKVLTTCMYCIFKSVAAQCLLTQHLLLQTNLWTVCLFDNTWSHLLLHLFHLRFLTQRITPASGKGIKSVPIEHWCGAAHTVSKAKNFKQSDTVETVVKCVGQFHWPWENFLIV